MGPKCPRALWYSVVHPELAEPVPPWAVNKFCYGHIIEAWAIALAKAAGHSVEGEGDELIVDGIKGHRDCIIDGCIVDVKSANSRGFVKFKDKTIAQNDSFGYLDQLDGYLVGSAEDDLVTDKEHAYLFAIDKELGHMVLYEHSKREDSIHERIASYKQIVDLAEPPPCRCNADADGKSGNIKLSFPANYNDFKWQCNPQLRCFLYEKGPVYLTKVVREPADHIPEINRHGQIIHNGR